jgi:hypothetical protein
VYFIVVATLMFAFPLVFAAVEASTTSASIDAALIGKWLGFANVALGCVGIASCSCPRGDSPVHWPAEFSTASRV